MPEKKCKKCEVVKPLDEFYKDKSKKDGVRTDCKECRTQYDNKYYEGNKEKKLERLRKRRQTDQSYREKLNEYNKQYGKKYRQDNKENINEYFRNRYTNDPVYALRNNVRFAIWAALKRNGRSKAGESILQYLPYTLEQLKDHLEKQFVEGMSWENYGEWHLDHIHPQSKLPYISMDEPNFQKCWALENLQPLWAEENQSKGAKIL